MKATINRILSWLSWGIIASMLILVILLSSLYFASTRFAEYRSDIEQFVSKVIQHPVEIGDITVSSSGLEPVFRLHNVLILNEAKTKGLLKAQELQIGVDLVGSLIKWQIKPDFLLIRGSELEIHQDKTGKISIAGVSLASSQVEKEGAVVDEFSSWIFEQSRVDLENLVLKWHFANGKTIELTGLYLKLYNGIFQHELKVSGKLSQEQAPAAIFKADLKLRGDVLKQTSFPLYGEVTVQNWSQSIDSLGLAGGDFFVPAGDIKLSIKNSKIPFKFFRQPIAINNMDANVSWNRNGDGFKINVGKIKFADNWLTLTGEGQLLFLDNSKMPIVDAKLGIKLSDLGKAKLYYPASLMPSSAVGWLDQAFVHSKLISGNMILRGPLEKFPFDHGEGKFLVDTIIRDVCLNYDSAWPRAENITGKMVFEGRAMTILARSAKILNEPIKSIKAVIPNLDIPVLHIDGAIDSDSSLGVKFVNACPLKKSIGRKLQDISLSGLMKFKLKFVMPLDEALKDEKTQIDGNIELYNNRIQPDGWGISIENLNGAIHFDGDDLVAKDFKGKLFNKPVDISISTVNASHKDVITRVNLAGNASIQDFEQAFSIKLAPYASGNFSYKALLDLHSIAVPSVFKLSSNLRGVEIKLPEPFDKKIQDPHGFYLTGYFGGNQANRVLINYNDQINAALTVKRTEAKGVQVVAGEVKLGGGASEVTTGPGLAVTGHLAKLDWSIWKDYLTKSQANFKAAGSIVKKVNLNIGELIAFGQVFKQVLLGAQSKGAGWELAFLTPDIDGRVYLPNANKAAIKGEFKKLYLSFGEQAISTLKPQNLPLLDLKVDSFRYGAKNFNRVAFVTEPQKDGVKITKIAFNGPRFNLEGSGDWLEVDNKQSTVFLGKISSGDVGGLLKQWDLTDNVVGGSGVAKFILRWPDSPYNPTLQTIRGNFSLNLANGRIINLSRQTENKLGFGKVFNMLSLQSLPRRLTLDFSDLTQKGFAFDTVVGEFDLAGNGNAIVKKLSFKGALAHIEASGRIGLKAQDYDVKINVAPQVSTSLPVAATATLLGGPVAGVVGLIADNIFSSVTKKVTRKAVNYNYQITGSWDKPNITKI